jgi:hypothetical protein
MKGRTGHARAWLVLVLLCSALAASCGKSEDTQQQPDPNAPCTPGEVNACACSDGSMRMAGCLPTGVMATCPCPMPAGQGGQSASGTSGGSTAGAGGMCTAGTYAAGTSAAGAGASGTNAGGTGGTSATGGSAAGAGGMTAAGTGGAPPAGDWPAADPAGMGPFETVTENNVGPDSAYTMFRPMQLDRRHPVITWGNGTGATPQSYRGMLTQFASHGFIVIASNSENVAQGTPPPMLNGVTWVIEQNDDMASPLYQHVDTMNIGATGHSQGAFATSTAGADERITTVAPIQGARAGTLHGPALLLCGGMDTIVPCSGSMTAFERISTVPVMYANLLAADHTMWVGSGFGGMRSPYFEVVTAWMRVHLMNDAALRPMFYGASCELCGDSAWDVMQKMMD